MVVASTALKLSKRVMKMRPALFRLGLFGIATFLIFLHAQAHAENTPQLRLDGQISIKSSTDAAHDFVFGARSEFAGPALTMSPFVPAPTQYMRFDEMDRGDRRLALAQVALQVVGKALEHPLGRALLAIREPLRDLGGDGIACKQRFSTKSYFLKCGIKF